jgi:hypothetical protein
LFHSKCNPRERAKMSRFNFLSQEKVDANEFCMKDLAISHLMERDKCAEKADRFVNYVFERCKNDSAPFTGGR